MILPTSSPRVTAHTNASVHIHKHTLQPCNALLLTVSVCAWRALWDVCLCMNMCGGMSADGRMFP